jgi:hypothetical protein
VLRHALLSAALGAVALATSAAHCADAGRAPERDEQPRARDAAEVVQEGNVTQWLEHYQRERGEEWAKQKADEAKPAPVPSAPGSPPSTR